VAPFCFFIPTHCVRCGLRGGSIFNLRMMHACGLQLILTDLHLQRRGNRDDKGIPRWMKTWEGLAAAGGCHSQVVVSDGLSARCGTRERPRGLQPRCAAILVCTQGPSQNMCSGVSDPNHSAVYYNLSHSHSFDAKSGSPLENLSYLPKMSIFFFDEKYSCNKQLFTNESSYLFNSSHWSLSRTHSSYSHQ
jgi:hypothetical protein